MSKKTREEIIKEIENNPSLYKITFKTLTSKEKKTFVSPMGDGRGWFKGVEKLSPRQMEERSRETYATPDDVYELKDNSTLDISTPADRVVWDWLKYCSNDLGLSLDEAAQSGVGGSYGQGYYVYLPEKESVEKLKKMNLVATAMNYINNATQEELYRKGYMFGTDFSGQSVDTVKCLLAETAQSNPQKIIDLFVDNKLLLQELIAQAVLKSIINKDARYGTYHYGENNTNIGNSIEQVVEFLKDPSNKKVHDDVVEKTYPSQAKKTVKPKE